ncbi:MAG: carbohydrate kinase family protein [Paracoccaceae bacterium]
MILACGEALVDVLTSPRPDGAPGPRVVPGGAAFNLAVALARLDQPAGLVAGLSTDSHGDLLRGRARAEGVSIDLCPLREGPTTRALVEEGEPPAYSFADQGSAGRLLRPEDMPALPSSATALAFGGISLAAEPCGTAFEALARREAGARVMLLDPNIRPPAVENPEDYRARLWRMAALADIVKLSDEDMAWLCPGDPAAGMRRLLECGAGLVVLTEGAAGARGATAEAQARVPAPVVPVADTVGAGDAFAAGLLSWLRREGWLTRAALPALDRAALTAALGFASRVAARSVTRPGADPPRLSELG